MRNIYEAEERYMNKEKRKYCIEVIISDLKKMGVTLEQLAEELDYRDRAGITEAKEGWDDDLYFYSTEELCDAEELWDIVN